MASDSPPDWLLALIPLGFLIGFPLLWLFVMWLLSRISGWSALAERYKASAPFAGPTQRCSANVGIVGYRNSLVVGANDLGLSIAVLKIFAMFHPPLFVPWSEVRAQRKRVLFIQTVSFELGSRAPVALRLRRRFADPLEAASQGRLAIAPEHGG